MKIIKNLIEKLVSLVYNTVESQRIKKHRKIRRAISRHNLNGSITHQLLNGDRVIFVGRKKYSVHPLVMVDGELKIIEES